MKIGIDISQLAHKNTGVANYLASLVEGLLKNDSKNEYILFFSSLRRDIDYSFVNGITGSRVRIKRFKFPPTLLDLLWNRLHLFPIENFIGDVDLFLTSDWCEPPTRKAKKGTIIYDMIVFKYPNETAKKIIDVQKRKLKWVKKESDIILCISEATKKDVEEILGIEEQRVRVVYPGI